MRLTYPFDLPTLPYSFESMHPCISDWTMQTHYECNHAGYVKKLNLILNSLPKLHQTALASIVLSSKGKLFNNAAQHLNHVFWWYTLKPPTILSVPDQPLLTQIQMDFGSFDDWKKDFHEKAMSIFGSGWCWTIWDKNAKKLKNETTANATVPNFYKGRQPILVCDIWEHAYFCDYKTDRSTYVDNFFKLINWDMASLRIKGEDKLFDLSV